MLKYQAEDSTKNGNETGNQGTRKSMDDMQIIVYQHADCLAPVMARTSK